MFDLPNAESLLDYSASPISYLYRHVFTYIAASLTSASYLFIQCSSINKSALTHQAVNTSDGIHERTLIQLQTHTKQRVRSHVTDSISQSREGIRCDLKTPGRGNLPLVNWPVYSAGSLSKSISWRRRKSVCSGQEGSRLPLSMGVRSNRPLGMNNHQNRLHMPFPANDWDINEISETFSPQVLGFDVFEDWPEGDCRRVYSPTLEPARKHSSGWAMRNTNNHNVSILKKSCLGVVVCSFSCVYPDGTFVRIRPAICDKARRKQCGKPCPNPACGGELQIMPCRGHQGYPVTHFWKHTNTATYFQGKGRHCHPRPEAKTTAESRKSHSTLRRQRHIRSLSSTFKKLKTAKQDVSPSHQTNEDCVVGSNIDTSWTLCACSSLSCRCSRTPAPASSCRTLPASAPLSSPSGAPMYCLSSSLPFCSDSLLISDSHQHMSCHSPGTTATQTDNSQIPNTVVSYTTSEQFQSNPSWQMSSPSNYNTPAASLSSQLLHHNYSPLHDPSLKIDEPCSTQDDTYSHPQDFGYPMNGGVVNSAVVAPALISEYHQSQHDSSPCFINYSETNHVYSNYESDSLNHEPNPERETFWIYDNFQQTENNNGYYAENCHLKTSCFLDTNNSELNTESYFAHHQQTIEQQWDSSSQDVGDIWSRQLGASDYSGTFTCVVSHEQYPGQPSCIKDSCLCNSNYLMMT